MRPLVSSRSFELRPAESACIELALCYHLGMATSKEPETENLFLRIPSQLKELLAAAVDVMNKERLPGSPVHTLNSMAVGVLWTFFTADDKTVDRPLPAVRRAAAKKVRAK